VVARAKPAAEEAAQELATATVQLRHENDQVTAFRFQLDGHGRLIAGSRNSIYKELRTAAQ
jgi:hypothetical protein